VKVVEFPIHLALGAFVAGMLISETEFRHQVEEDIKLSIFPFS
jgi:Kef-type K+ transport system membrane component KefB